MSDFDPKAYLAKMEAKGQPGAFDPKAYLAKKAPPAAPAAAPEPPSAVESGLRGAAQGATLGFGDEIQGGIQALLRKYVQDDARGKSLPDLYREERGHARADNAQAQQANPNAYLGGQMLGGIAPGVLGGGAGAAAKGLGIGARAASSAASGLTQGAIAGLGGSEADLTKGQIEKALDDARSGGLVGAGLGAAAPVLGAAANSAAGALQQGGLNTARRFLAGGMSRFAARNPLPEDSVRAGLAEMRPWRSLEGTRDALVTANDKAGQDYGNILASLKAKGVVGPQAEQLAQQMQDAGRAVPMSGNTNPVPRAVFDREAAALRALEPDGSFSVPRHPTYYAQNPATPTPPGAMLPGGSQPPPYGPPIKLGGELPLDVAEGVKRGIQGQVDYGVLADSNRNAALKKAAAMVRQANEDAVAQQAHLAPTEAASFIPVKNAYGNVTNALDLANEGVARKMGRNALSMRDMAAGVAGAAHYGAPGIAAAPAMHVAREFLPQTFALGATHLGDALLTPTAQTLGRGAISGAPAAGGVDFEQIRKLLDR